MSARVPAPLEGRRAVIIGGGISGLTAGYELARRGARVTLLERREVLGGLARACPTESRDLEAYYHFICRGDSALLSLLDELGLGAHVEWRPALTSYYVRGRLYPFTTPAEILRFTPLPLADRLRFGRHVARCRRMTDWEPLDGLTAEAWLRREAGPRVYELLWRPLLETKFGSYAGQVSAPWIWHRLWRASRSRKNLLRPEDFGCLREGSEVLLRTLAARIRESGGEVLTGTPATGLVVRGGQVAAVTTAAGELPADLVVAAAPLPELARLLPAELEDWRRELLSVDFLGVRCLRLRLDRAVTGSYWVNANDPRVPFGGFIEYSHLNPAAEPGGAVVYVPLYMSREDPRFTMAEADLSGELVRGLQVVSPALREAQVREARLVTDDYAQAICPPGFAQRVPPLAAPVPGLYLLDSTQLYPSDRCLSGMIALARQLGAQASKPVSASTPKPPPPASSPTPRPRRGWPPSLGSPGTPTSAAPPGVPPRA